MVVVVVVMTDCRESLGSHESFQRPREGCFIFEQKVGMSGSKEGQVAFLVQRKWK